MQEQILRVVKRNGTYEAIMFDKISKRLSLLAKEEPSLSVNVTLIAQKVIHGIYDGIKTSELDHLAAETAIWMYGIHPDYSTMAARILISNLHKETFDDYYTLCEELISEPSLITQELFLIVKRYREKIQKALDYKKDYDYKFFGYKVLEKAYLIKRNGKVMERPQHLYMRVAIGINKWDIEGILTTYRLLSEGKYIHATPTLFNAGRINAQLASCFLLATKEDSIEGIYDTMKQCAIISKNAGGIGLHIHDVRSEGSYIKGTDGYSNGLVPMLRVFNETARYVDQGGGKRKGSFAVYLEPWHADIEKFLELKKNTGKEEQRCRDLFYGLWIPDLFMERVENNSHWSLFCPSICPGLSDVWGEDFAKLYITYETSGKASKTIKARDLWESIIVSQIETGTPYMLYKDACNRKSNQNNLGTIKCSNLCAEIVEYTSEEEIATCNLASVSLPKFVNEEKKCFDHNSLYETVSHVTRALNKVIDTTFYPLKETKFSNQKNRPLGIGVQGLAETFFKLRYPFDSNEAKQLNKEIFETMYFAALSTSCELAEKEGHYASYPGSLLSRGYLCHDMWDVNPSMRWDWDSLKERMEQFGVRNSLLLALMPTASTSSILNNTECFEPISSNIYTRRLLSGDFTVVNTYLMNDLLQLGLWSSSMKDTIIAHGGSIQNIGCIPKELKDLYKTVWEIKTKDIINMAIDRSAYIDQSQSMNIFMENPTKPKMTSMHFYTWKAGLKTGMYYLRTKPATNAIAFTIDDTTLLKEDKKEVCTMQEGCISCGS
jgi:ribonucleoside-diphosphate reductase alpha subunit